MDSARLLVFTFLWTAIWAASLPRLSRRAELIAGLVPFTAFGLRVFASFFTGVADDDPVKATVAPLVEWVVGQTGVVPYQVILDATVAIGLVWLASVFDIPKQSRVATAWLMPAAAMLSLASLRISGLPLEQLLATTLPALVLGMAFGGLIAAVIWLTPSPIEVSIRRRAAVVVCITVPVAVIAVECLAPTPMSTLRNRASPLQPGLQLDSWPGGSAASGGLAAASFSPWPSAWRRVRLSPPRLADKSHDQDGDDHLCSRVSLETVLPPFSLFSVSHGADGRTPQSIT